MQAVTFMLAFVAVLGLIVLAAWLVRRFANNRLGANTNRGRMPRLAVIDAAAVDGRRRLVLVRRDNVEHLLMIGGPSDIVVEPNIVRAQARGDQLPQRPPGAEPPPRIAPLPDAASWLNGEDHHPEQQAPEPPPRPARPSFADELRRPERRSESLTSLAPEPMNGRPEPKAPEPKVETRPEPIPQRMARGEPLIPRPSRQQEPPLKTPAVRAERASPPPPPAQPAPPVPPAQTADQNLAEMAQRLEAALRRPAGSADAPPVAPEPQPARATRTEPAPSPKTSFENLEEEMASLLGRPKSPSSS
jgi:flagellar protein FliO/FliZ